MDKSNETEAALDKISRAVHALSETAKAFWERWKIQGDVLTLKCGAGYVFIGRREGFSGIILVKNNGEPQAIEGAPLEVKVELLCRAEEFFDAYGERARRFWGTIDAILPTIPGIADRAIEAAEGRGPQR